MNAEKHTTANEIYFLRATYERLVRLEERGERARWTGTHFEPTPLKFLIGYARSLNMRRNWQGLNPYYIRRALESCFKSEHSRMKGSHDD